VLYSQAFAIVRLHTKRPRRADGLKLRKNGVYEVRPETHKTRSGTFPEFSKAEVIISIIARVLHPFPRIDQPHGSGS
jgi:hypothetical protein